MSRPSSDQETIILRLYVTGQTPSSRQAIEHMQELCESRFRGQYDLEVIDVREDPARAEQDNIMATPALVKELPEPLRKLIGDLSDHERVVVGLELPEERLHHGEGSPS